MLFDLKKEFKKFYLSKNIPKFVEIPCINYVALRGAGGRNEERGNYQLAICILYTISCAIKMSYRGDYKIRGFFEHVIPLLKGFWC